MGCSQRRMLMIWSEHDVEVALDAAHILRRIERKIVEVETGAEGLAFAREDNHAAILVQTHLDEEVVELAHLLVRHGVEVSGVVERADVDRTALVDQQLLVIVVELRQMVTLLVHAHRFRTPFPVLHFSTFDQADRLSQTQL